MTETLQIGEFALQRDTRQAVWPDGQALLTRQESELLQLLWSNRPSPVSRDTLFQTIWGDSVGSRNRLMMAMYRLKKKVADGPKAPLTIHSVGEGFTVTAAGEAPQTQGLPLSDRVLDVHNGAVQYGDALIRLTNQERKIVAYLSKHGNQWMLKSDLYTEIWGVGAGDKSNHFGVVLNRLRKKLEAEPSAPQHLRTQKASIGLFWTDEVSMPAPTETEKRESAFVGRTETLLHLEDTLSKGTRCLTLIGPGGFGKTRTVRKLLEREALKDLYPGGMVFCDLVNCQSGTELVERVAQSLQLRLGGGSNLEELVAQVGGALALRPRNLILLDNFEQLVEYGTDTVAKWVRLAGNTQFMVTSRRRLGLSTEQVFPLEPLPLQDGMTLFIHQLQQLQPKLRLGVRERKRITPIITGLEGNALAILLTVGQLQHESLDDWLAAHETASSQTQLLDNVIQRSWSLLPPAERDVLQQAMVFRGGFGLESAEAILWTDAGWIDDIIESLLDHSLLYCRMDTGTARYELYESVKAFISKQQTPTEHHDIPRRFLAYYLDRCDDWWAYLQKHGDDAQSLQIAAERANLWQAFEWAQRDSVPGEDALNILIYELSRSRSEYTRILAHSEQLTTYSSPKHKGLILGHLTELYRQFNRLDEALALQKRMSEDDSLPSEIRLYMSYGLHMSQMHRTGDVEPCETFIIDTLADLPPRTAARAFFINGLARIRMDQNQKYESIRLCREAIEHGRGQASKAFIEGLEGNIGHSLAGLGHLDEAYAILAEKLEQMQSSRHVRFDKVTTCWTLGQIDLARGQFSKAYSHFQQGLATALNVGDVRFVRVMAALKASTLYLMGDAAEAAQCYELHPAEPSPASFYDEVASSLYALYRLHIGDTEVAKQLWQNAQPVDPAAPKAKVLDTLWEAHLRLALSPEDPEAIAFAAEVLQQPGLILPRTPVSEEESMRNIGSPHWVHVIWLETLAQRTPSIH